MTPTISCSWRAVVTSRGLSVSDASSQMSWVVTSRGRRRDVSRSDSSSAFRAFSVACSQRQHITSHQHVSLSNYTINHKQHIKTVLVISSIKLRPFHSVLELAVYFTSHANAEASALNQSINQSMGFVKRPLQSWTVALDRSTVIKYNKIKYDELQ